MINDARAPKFNAHTDMGGREFFMSKCTKGLLIAALCVLSTWLGLSCLYTYSVSEELTLLRRESRSDTVYLRHRVRELESELNANRGMGMLPPSAPAGGEAEDTEAVTDSGESDSAADTAPTAPDGKEEVTLPTHQSPETQSPAEDETASPASLYLIAEQDGVIGLFDASGAMLRSVNVFVMTLPEADREALSVGIPAYSWGEALELLERFE